MPVGDPRFGKPVLCDCQAEAARERHLAKLLAMSGMTPAMARMTFASFDTRQTPELAEALSCCVAYAAEPDGWLYLQGGFGCGKTHLLAAIALALMRRKIGALYVVVPELLDRMRATFGSSSQEGFATLWDRILTSEVLILDDLGAERVTDWVSERLYTLIDHRYREAKPLVIASNLAPEAIGGRIGSRLRDVRLTTVVSIGAGDYRSGR